MFLKCLQDIHHEWIFVLTFFVCHLSLTVLSNIRLSVSYYVKELLFEISFLTKFDIKPLSKVSRGIWFLSILTSLMSWHHFGRIFKNSNCRVLKHYVRKNPKFNLHFLLSMLTVNHLGTQISECSVLLFWDIKSFPSLTIKIKKILLIYPLVETGFHIDKKSAAE